MASSPMIIKDEPDMSSTLARTAFARLSREYRPDEPLQSLDRIAQSNRVKQLGEKEIASYLEVAPDAVVVTDRDGRIVQVNAQAEKMFGYARNEMFGQKIEMLMPERFRQRHVQQRIKYSVNPVTRPMGNGQRHLFGLRNDGKEFPVDISLGLLPTEDAIFIASAIRDMTVQRQLEAKLQERTRQLEEANHNKDEFLGMLAHELRNPLGAISNAVEVLRLEPSGSPAWALDIICRQTNQIMHLMEDLMDVSRIAHGKVSIRKVLVELGPLISQAIEAVQPLLNIHKQQITVTLPPKPVTLLADPVRLVEVFTNLLNNAAKYTDNGGQIALIAAEEDDEVIVQFLDTGIGISAEMLPRIFDPFTQVSGARNRSEGGIGVGLAVVANLVRLHGGAVQAFSDGPGHGSQFVVRLPLALLDTEDDAAGRLDHPPAESVSRCTVKTEKPMTRGGHHTPIVAGCDYQAQ